jgi:orotidine-5'-phosphate decarboxylase
MMTARRPGRARAAVSTASADAASRLIVALDVETLPAALQVARRLRGVVRRVKVGSVLFTGAGPEAIRRLRALGFEVFLDLKFHDIPSTVEKSVRAAAHHGVWMLTVHASGQRAMLEAAVRGAREEASRLGRPRPLLVGVTVLTSVEAAPPSAVTRRVLELADAARRAGLDGVVASPQEAAALRRRLGPGPLIVCPGIRPADGQAADQQRIATPSQALAAGASCLVVGRPIVEAPDPRARARQILTDMDAHGIRIRTKGRAA